MNNERNFQADKEEPNENKPDYQDSENEHEIRIRELSQMIVSSPTAMGTVECILP